MKWAEKLWTPKVYDRMARYYDTLARWLFPIAEKGHRRVVQGLDSGSLLDIACGTGSLLALACANGLTCYGMDTSGGMLAQAGVKSPGARFNKGSFYKIPYADEAFDFVVETNAVSGVGIDARKVLTEMIRVCKPGGEVRIADYVRPPRRTWATRILAGIGILVGDVPKDYKTLFNELGFEPDFEVLGGYGMYQFIRVRKL